jgi:glycosyltransferase involved in cell wall biosynthesis
LRILYVNHTAMVSGAEHSLLVMLRALAGAVSPVLACPEGPLARAARAAAVPVHAISGTNLSARLDPLHTPREAVAIPAAAVAIRTLARRLGADLVHANTPRAGLLAALARGASGARPIVHVRDSMPPGRLPAVMFAGLSHAASAFVPTSEYLAAQLPRRPLVRTVPNAVEPARFDPAAVDPERARARLGLAARDEVLAVVGQISPHKGQRDAIEIIARVRRTRPAARLLVAGSVKFSSAATRFDNRGYEAELRALARRLGVEPAVGFLGERTDVAELLSAVDVVLVPSWYEPFGRVALEAMAMQVPVVATSVGGIAEVVRDGVEGLVLPPRRPELWAEQVAQLLADPRRRRSLGAGGRHRVLERYTPEGHACAILGLYRDVLMPAGRRC